MNELGLFIRTLTERVSPELLLERVVGGPPDDWQRKLMNSTADIIMVLASRRIGKSTTVGVMAGQELAKPEHEVIILSKTLPQAQLLFAKIAYTWEKMALPIETRRRTLTEMHLANGSIVRCVPAGQDTWWYESDRVIDWRSPRCSAYLVAYLQIANGPIPLTGIPLDDGFIHPDRSVMQALDHAGCVRMDDGMFHLTDKGEALVTPWLQIDRATGFSVTVQRRRG